MISPAYAAWLCNCIYEPVTPDVFSSVQSFDAVTVGISSANGMQCVTFAGSESGLDWLRDFEAVPWEHPQLGVLHAGFWQGMEPAFEALRPKLTGSIAIQGHSLGCAHASILAGLCAVNGIAVDQLTLFAPPRPGYQQLQDIINAHVKVRLAYRNGPDPVPEVPISLPGFPWIGPSLTHIEDSPSGIEALDPARWHSISLYRKAAPDHL